MLKIRGCLLLQSSIPNSCFYFLNRKTYILFQDDDPLEGSSDMPPDEVFNMIVQAPWEEDIVWSSEEYKPSKKCIIAQTSAGWVPSGNIRTLQGYLAHAYRKGNKIHI